MVICKNRNNCMVPIVNTYTHVPVKLGLDPLEDRKHALNLKFLNNLLSGKVDCPTLLSLIGFKVPQYTTCSKLPFYTSISTTNYLKMNLLLNLLYLLYYKYICSKGVTSPYKLIMKQYYSVIVIILHESPIYLKIDGIP